MDFKNRTYYKVKFSPESILYRIEMLKCLDSITYSNRKGFTLVSCKKGQEESIEYDLRKAERRDYYCEWVKIEKPTNR